MKKGNNFFARIGRRGNEKQENDTMESTVPRSFNIKQVTKVVRNIDFMDYVPLWVFCHYGVSSFIDKGQRWFETY